MLNPRLANLTTEGMKKLYSESQAMPFKYYIPNRPIADLIREIGVFTPMKRIYLITAGNGVGKTSGAINIVANIVWGNQNIYRDIVDIETGERLNGFFNYELFNNFPPSWPKNIWYISNKDSLVDAIWPEFQKWIPEQLYKDSKKGKSYVAEVLFKRSGGWRLFFKTDEQEPKTFESANVSIVIFDEPPPYQLYKAAISRLRAGGIVIIPATPLMGAGWFIDAIVEKVETDGDKYHSTVPCWTNCIERAGKWDLGIFGIQNKGNLAEANINFTLRNFKDPDERDARENGTFKHLTGLVYKTYDRNLHYRHIPAVVGTKGYMYRFILDPHDRKPPMVAFERFDQWGRRSVIREWPGVTDKEYNGMMWKDIKSADPYTIDDFAKIWTKIMRDEIGMSIDRVQCIIDPNFGNKPNRQTGKLVFQEYQEAFAKHGWPIAFITNVNDSIPTRHKMVKTLLKPTVDNDLKLIIDKSCVNMDWCFRNYSFDEHSGKAADKKALCEKVKEIGKDGMDLIGYSAMLPFFWEDLPKSTDPYEDKDYEEAPKAGWRERVSGSATRPAGVKGV